MAFASVGSRGTANSKTNGQSFSFSPSGSVPVDALLVVFVAWDNTNAASADGPMSRQMSCIDDAGNIYCTIFGGQGLGAGSGAVSTHTMAFMFVTKVRNALTTSSVLTLKHFQPPPNAKDAKAVSLWEFSMDAGMTFANVGDSGPQQVVTNAADPASITLSSMDSQEYLMLHILSAEGPSTDAYTWDSDYTQITTSGTTGGADTTNQTVNGGFRIATLTTDTVDVTSTTADRDYCQGFTALCQVPEVTNFPITGILDDFNRADELPLDNGTWEPSLGDTPGNSTTQRLQILSNRAARSSALGTDSAGQWWLDESPVGTTCNEVYVSTPVAITGDADSGVGVILRGVGSATGTSVEGYGSGWVKANPGPGRGTSHDLATLGKLSTVGNALPKIIAHAELTDSGRLGIREDREVVHLMMDSGGGFLDIGAVYFSTGLADINQRFGLQLLGGSFRADDFGGGKWCGGWLPQIYRLVETR